MELIKTLKCSCVIESANLFYCHCSDDDSDTSENYIEKLAKQDIEVIDIKPEIDPAIIEMKRESMDEVHSESMDEMKIKMEFKQENLKSEKTILENYNSIREEKL